MANPSLQIGNSNWAIKEDDLLGYSTVGTNYLPKPMTMTRASAGTRVNPEGLVEDVELLGSELVTSWANNDFASFASNGSNITQMVSSGSGNNNYSAVTITNGKIYKLKFTSSQAITCQIRISSNTSLTSATVVSSSLSLGLNEVYFTASSNYTYIGFYAPSSFTDTQISDFTFKEATIDNLARVDYTDGTSSLLVEPQRRNLVTYSESISNLSSNTNGTGTFTITDNYTDSPQGVQNASRVQMYIVDTNDTSNYRLINTGSVMTNGVTREISFYAKSLTGSNQDVLVYWSYDQQIVTLTNDWQRFKISATSGNTGSIFIGTRGGSGSYFSGGDGNLDFALWGLQVEDDGSGGGSSYATSYIPTSGGTVTRVQDQYSKTGISNLINSEEGVLFVEMAALSESNLNSYITIGQNTSNGILGISFYTGSNNILLDHWEGASETYHIESISDVTEFNKIAICYDGTSIKGYINGSPVWNTTVTAWSSNALSELNFAFGNSGTNKFLGKVKQLQVFKTALTDEQLKTLTT